MSKDTQEMPQSRSTALPRHQKRDEEQIMTNNDKTNALANAETKKN